jgi:hypothetical protein
MIILISSSKQVLGSVSAIEGRFPEPVACVPSLQAGWELLNVNAYSAVVVDEQDSENSSTQIEHLFQNLGGAIPVIVNLAITSTDRLLAILRAALERRKREMTLADENALRTVASEFRDGLAAVLLSCEIARKQDVLPESVVSSLEEIERVSASLAKRLDSLPAKSRASAANA